MATPVEMMAKQLFKALGVNPEEVMNKVTEMHGLFVAGFQNAQQANRRLHRIETHLGLSDIEAIPTLMVISHENPDLDGRGPLAGGAGPDGTR